MPTAVIIFALWALVVLVILGVLLAVWWRQRTRSRAADSPPMDAVDLLLRALLLIAIVTMAAFFLYMLLGFPV
jgi:O-antigen ligase